MTNQKIFFSDLDGTLLDSQKHISDRLRSAVMNYMDQGNVLALSSGRPLDSIKEVVSLHNLMHDNLYCIGYNGALTYHFNTEAKIIEKTLTLDQMEVIATVAARAGIYCHTYDDTNIIAPRESEELAFYTKTVHLPVTVLPNYPKGIKVPACKILCIELSGTDKLDKLAETLLTALPGIITCVKSNPYLLEVFPISAGKGTAVTELCARLNIPVSNSYAAGDEQNDISMIKAAGTGIAMLNARDIVRDAADVITTLDNDHDGLYEFFAT